MGQKVLRFQISLQRVKLRGISKKGAPQKYWRGKLGMMLKRANPSSFISKRMSNNRCPEKKHEINWVDSRVTDGNFGRGLFF